MKFSDLPELAFDEAKVKEFTGPWAIAYFQGKDPVYCHEVGLDKETGDAWVVIKQVGDGEEEPMKIFRYHLEDVYLDHWTQCFPPVPKEEANE